MHEGVHAFRDMQGARLTYAGKPYRPRASTDEAAAYVGGCLFDVHVQEETGAAAAKPAWLGVRKSPVHAIAYGIALRQAAKRPGSAVDRADLSTLFGAITASARRNGSPMPRFYEYDGVPL